VTVSAWPGGAREATSVPGRSALARTDTDTALEQADGMSDEPCEIKSTMAGSATGAHASLTLYREHISPEQ
jgi:hypothetical protein